ncbi:MAG TPA: tetratricopeptide repeat protein [Flavobacteriales bacterium]|nr:tetratricopeptide repeat protein [Flavobacteriales bacterium]
MRTFTVLAGVALLAACGGGTPEGDGADTTEAVKRIRAMEDSVFENLAFDQRSAQALLDVYKAFASAHPVDSMAPEYLFRAAGVARSVHDADQGLRLYDRIIADYPSWRRLPDVYYLKAFTLDSDLDRKGEARTAYTEVINRFPDHPFARDARAMIENLGLSDAELIEKFERMQADSAAAVQ